MKTIELLKCLCGYLPYELKCKVSQKHKGDWEGIITDVDFINETFRIKAKGLIWKYQPLSNIKPILRPLSDLTKEIEHVGEKFVPIDELQKLYPMGMRDVRGIDFVELSGQWMLNTNRDGEVAINVMRRIDQKLYEWHFDIHNLIERGYAVNKNEIERC